YFISRFLGPREQSTIAIKLKVPRVTYILAKLAYPIELELLLITSKRSLVIRIARKIGRHCR
ncbi:hypothetical protein L249_1024, partial [Ophiocordyceps polyrhachis-furcata BCC 54312]